jgi:hypothetical protein
MASANNQIGRRTEPTGELPAERRVIQRPATQFAQALEAAFHLRLRKCSLSVLWDELVRRRSVSCRAVRRLWHGPTLAANAQTPLATSVYNPPSDPVTQLPKALAISVVHDHQTRLAVLSDVRGFLGIGINSDHAAGGRVRAAMASPVGCSRLATPICNGSTQPPLVG